MSSPLPRRLVAVAILALAVAACAADTPVRPKAGSPRPRVEPGPMLAIGDSLMEGLRDSAQLETLLTDTGWEPEIVASKGTQVTWGTTQVESRTTVPPTVVVTFGLNPSPTLGNFPEQSAAFIAALRERGAKRILWVPPHHIDPVRYQERADALRAQEDRVLTVLDWPSVIDLHPEWFQSDGFHLTADGYAALANFIRISLATP